MGADMDHREKLHQLAQILIRKHSDRADGIARERAHDGLDSQDFAAAHLWTDVAEIVAKIAGSVGDPRIRQGVLPLF
jgi:hypothetical protein